MTEDLAFDIKAFEKLVEHVISGGIHGIFILGTNGEGASLTFSTRKNILQESAALVSGRVPLFVNISSVSYLETLELAEYAAGSGANYVVLTPPFYFPMDQRELRRYFEMVADRSRLPLFIYNAPQYTKNSLNADTVKDLASHNNIIGIKDSSGNMDYIRQLLEDRRDESFSILVGPENMLGPCVLLGCNGGVNGGGNIFPGLYVKMYEAALARDSDAMKYYQEIIERVYKSLYEVPDTPMGTVVALKYVLSAKAICKGKMVLPVYEELSNNQKKIIDNFIDEMDQNGF
ncbi:MAG: dihydrodipicolinate synthase family protein [Bacteroidales bacterium]|nr:dihydrodipicolinate synthase family protein [Bacteroidales bacterium]